MYVVPCQSSKFIAYIKIISEQLYEKQISLVLWMGTHRLKKSSICNVECPNVHGDMTGKYVGCHPKLWFLGEYAVFYIQQVKGGRGKTGKEGFIDMVY